VHPPTKEAVAAPTRLHLPLSAHASMGAHTSKRGMAAGGLRVMSVRVSGERTRLAGHVR